VSESDPRVVKARLNLSGTRIIGFITLGPGHTRLADVLNGSSRFLFVHESSATSHDSTPRAVNIEQLSYVNAIEEPERAPGLRIEGTFRRVRLTLQTLRVVIEGDIFIPRGEDLPHVLDADRRFINLRDVTFVNGVETYAYLAVGGRHVTFAEPVRPE
jgi:hypothetical protein